MAVKLKVKSGDHTTKTDTTPPTKKVELKVKTKEPAPKKEDVVPSTQRIALRVKAAPDISLPQQAFPQNTPVLPIYRPNDVVTRLKINDTRTINPATGMPFKQPGGKTTEADPEKLKLIIAHAKAKGIDPYTALAIAYQEQNFGDDDYDFGTVNSYSPDEDVSYKYADLQERKKNENANLLAKAIKDKQDYARRLGVDKKGEAFVLQAYNGLGKLKPQKGEGTRTFYGVPASESSPINLAENPLYGKTVMSLRDEILKKNPEIQKIIDATPAWTK